MNSNRKKEANLMYMILGGVFIALLVTCNLIFQKFIVWNPFGLYEFKISAGLLPYPITFLVTDIISEIYGQRKANHVVLAGLISTIVVMLLVALAQYMPAMANSPVSDSLFTKVFGLTVPAVTASMAAYLIAQFIDIKLFHFWKKLTKGKHLWLRNNFSTLFSQLFDTTIVIALLCFFESLEWSNFLVYFSGAFLFKVIFAIIDTPFFYAAVIFFRKRYGLTETTDLSEL